MNLIAWALFNFLNCSSWQTAVCNVGFRDKLILWQNVNYLHFPPLSLNNLFTATPLTIPQSLLTKCLHAEWRSCSREHWAFLLQCWADLSSLCKVASNSIHSRVKRKFFFFSSVNTILYKLVHTSGCANVMLLPLKDLCVCGKCKKLCMSSFYYSCCIILAERCWLLPWSVILYMTDTPQLGEDWLQIFNRTTWALALHVLFRLCNTWSHSWVCWSTTIHYVGWPIKKIPMQRKWGRAKKTSECLLKIILPVR